MSILDVLMWLMKVAAVVLVGLSVLQAGSVHAAARRATMSEAFEVIREHLAFARADVTKMMMRLDHFSERWPQVEGTFSDKHELVRQLAGTHTHLAASTGEFLAAMDRMTLVAIDSRQGLNSILSKKDAIKRLVQRSHVAAQEGDMLQAQHEIEDALAMLHEEQVAITALQERAVASSNELHEHFSETTRLVSEGESMCGLLTDEAEGQKWSWGAQVGAQLLTVVGAAGAAVGAGLVGGPLAGVGAGIATWKAGDYGVDHMSERNDMLDTVVQHLGVVSTGVKEVGGSVDETGQQAVASIEVIHSINQDIVDQLVRLQRLINDAYAEIQRDARPDNALLAEIWALYNQCFEALAKLNGLG